MSLAVMKYPGLEDWVPRHRITVDEYHRMARLGLLAPDARVELIEGEIIKMAPIGNSHGTVVDRLTRLFIRAVGDSAIVRVQGSVRLDRRTEPQPDLALLKPCKGEYLRRHPGPDDILLLIEVSDTTWRYDRQVKVPLYARHGVPAVWLIDIAGNQLHCFSAPADGAYAEATCMTNPGITPVKSLPDAAIDLSRLLSE